MHYFGKQFVTSGDNFLVLEPEDWTPEQYQAFLDIFGLKEAERIVINEYKLEVYGTEKEKKNVCK
jgi:hypothetical protein